MPDARTAYRALAMAALGALAAGSAVAADQQDFATIERGRYLTIAGDCAACHTVPGGQSFAGDLPIETPFGMLRSPNITPDRETGIGAWTDDEFVDALQKGRGRDGAHLYPAMPYTYYDKVSRKDALAIRAYLETLPPVHHEVQVNRLPFPLNIRAAMIGWNVLFFHPQPFQPAPGKSTAWNRGAYLVEGLEHCGACHTPKNLLGADKTGEALQGYPLQGWFAADLTTDPRRGLGGWSADDLTTYLKTGHNRFAAASGPMAQVVEESTSKLTDGDLQAIAAYLKDQPAPNEPQPAPLAADDGAMRMGAAVYRDECSACHTPTGKGIARLFPVLAGSAAVQSVDPTSVIHVILRGAKSAGTAGAPTAPAMPPFGWLLSDEQTAAVATYIRNAWGNAAPKVAAGTVAKERHALVERTD